MGSAPLPNPSSCSEASFPEGRGQASSNSSVASFPQDKKGGDGVEGRCFQVQKRGGCCGRSDAPGLCPQWSWDRPLSLSPAPLPKEPALPTLCLGLTVLELSRIQAALSLVMSGLPWRHDAVRSRAVCSAACCHLPGEGSPSPQSTPPRVHLPVCLLLSVRTLGPGVVLRTDNQCLLFSLHNANPSELTASIQNECESQRPSALVLLGSRRAGRGAGEAR